MRNRLGFMSHFICADCHVLGISAITLDIRARENGFARLKCGYFRSDRFNHARNIPAKGERKSMGNHLLQIALPDLPVDGINRCCDDPDQHIRRLNLRQWRLFVCEYIALAVLMDSDCFHLILLDTQLQY